MADGDDTDARSYGRQSEQNPDLTLTGAWHYPGGGGYEAVSTRIE